MSLPVKRLWIILFGMAVILLIPLVAMQFTEEVNWSLSDFLIAGILLFGSGLIIDIGLRKIKNTYRRVGYVIAILLLLFLIWAELAVGIIDSLFNGN